MPARRQARPTPGASPVLPRVDDEQAQRAFDRISVLHQQLANRTSAIAAGLGGMTGRFLGRQIFTASGTYLPAAGTRYIRVRMTGGGGGGGGAVGGANAAIGAGGASGFYLELVVDGVTVGGAVTVGGGGSGGGTGGGNGTDGGATSIAIDSSVFTAPGGDGGDGQPVSALSGIAQGGSDAPISPAGVDVVMQMPGEAGVLISGTGATGAGGSGPFGGGGFSFHGTPSDGNTGSGYGGGGSGALATAVGKSGGAGSPGLVIVEEYT